MANFDLEYISTPGKNRILGLAYPMRLDGVGGSFSQNENLGTLRDGIIQLLMTSPGERVMRPDFGTDLRAAVFEPLDQKLLLTIKTSILEALNKYEPRVIVKSLQVIPIWETNQVAIELLITTSNDLLNTQMVEMLV
tara:strand:- start:307 stop:717 length:411 start_codon:yes stop_codon:yes gene_type:complete